MIRACGLLTAGLVLAFSTALDVQFSLPKLFVLRAGATAIGLIWIRRAWRGELRGLPPVIVVPAAGLLIWWGVITATAVHVPTALDGAHTRYNGLWTHATWLLLALAIATAGLRVAELVTLTRWIVIATVPCAVYAVAQFAGLDPIAWPGPRSASTIGNPVILAATLGLTAPLSLVLARMSRSAAERRAWYGALVLLLAGIFTTLSRGPFAATLGALLLAGGAIAADAGRRAPPLRAMAIGAAMVVVLAAGGYWQLSRTRAGLFGAAEASRTLSDRANTYDAAWRIVRDHPVRGVGFENFSIVYPRYRRPESERITPDVLPTMAHSGYLHAAATTGVPGLLLYLAFMAGALIALAGAWRACDDRREGLLLAGLMASIAGYLVQDLTGWLEVSATSVFYVVIGVALALAGTRRGSLTRASSTPWLIAAVAATAISAWLTWQAVELLRADRSIRRARALDVRQQWDRIDAELRAALSDGVMRIAAYPDRAGMRYLDRFAASGSPEVLTRAVALFDRAGQANPFAPDPFLHRLLLDATALQRQAPVSGVDARIAELVEMDPNNGTVHATIARVRLAQHRHADARAALEAARRLRPGEPRYDELDGDIAHDQNDRTAALAAYRKAVAGYELEERALWAFASGKLVLKMIELGFTTEAVAHADRVLAAFPREAVMHTLRGYALASLGHRDEARRAFQAALLLDPNDRSAREGLASVASPP